nr:hypothetical protein BaRGS_003925 [Batillaria attramentaria]
MKTTTAGRKNGIQWTLWTQLDDLDFADDLALLSHSHSQMQDKTTRLEATSAGTGLKINRKKTELMKIYTTANTPVTVGGEPIREVESFVYLGSVVDGQGGTDRDVTARIGKARAAMVMLKNVWASKVVSIRTKLRIFNSNVKSVLLYGCETWRTTKTMQQKIQTFLNTCPRRIFNIRWPEKIRNEELWERAGQEPVAKQILRRKWGWIGHTLRKPASSTTRQALTWNPQGKRKRGRPRNSWRRDTEAELWKQPEFPLKFNKNETCVNSCQKTYEEGDKADVKKLNFLKRGISLNYQHHWIIDNMPVTWCYQVEDGQTFCSTGFPMGCYVTQQGKPKDYCVANHLFSTPDTYYVFNHVDIVIDFHPGTAEDWGQNLTGTRGRIVAAKIIPRSLLNSFVVALFLSCMLAMIMLRTLYKDKACCKQVTSAVSYVCLGTPSGYVSARLYKTFGGEKWRLNVLMTAFLCPGVVFVIFFWLNLVLWSKGSSAAVPCSTLIALLALWLGISVPLTFIGGYFGFRKPIPHQSLCRRPLPGIVMGGILPFGCIFIQIFFILNSICAWMCPRA